MTFGLTHVCATRNDRAYLWCGCLGDSFPMEAFEPAPFVTCLTCLLLEPLTERREFIEVWVKFVVGMRRFFP